MSEEKKKKKEGNKTKKGVNWSLILIFFLLGFMLTIPSMISRMLPVAGSRVAKAGSDVYILRDSSTIVHLRDTGAKYEFVSLISAEGDTVSEKLEPQLALSGNKMFIAGANDVKVFIYDPEKKDFIFYNSVPYERSGDKNDK